MKKIIVALIVLALILTYMYSLSQRYGGDGSIGTGVIHKIHDIGEINIPKSWEIVETEPGGLKVVDELFQARVGRKYDNDSSELLFCGHDPIEHGAIILISISTDPATEKFTQAFLAHPPEDFHKQWHEKMSKRASFVAAGKFNAPLPVQINPGGEGHLWVDYIHYELTRMETDNLIAGLHTSKYFKDGKVLTMTVAKLYDSTKIEKAMRDGLYGVPEEINNLAL